MRTVEITFYRSDTHEKLGTWFVASKSSEDFDEWMGNLCFGRPQDDKEASKFIHYRNAMYACTDEEQVIKHITKRERW